MFKFILRSVMLIGLFLNQSVKAFNQTDLEIDNFKPFAIFGEDNRLEPFEANDIEFKSSRSVAGRFSLDHLISTGNNYVLQRPTLGKIKCPNIRYAEQMVGPTCSGFLIKPDVLVTAGHCMNIETKCSENVWVFGFELKQKGDHSYKSILGSNVYRCTKILSQKYALFGDIDYAIIQLDRPVVDRSPLVMDFETNPLINSKTFIAGYPSGLPLKITNSGIVQKNDSSYAFDTDLDIFQGNSGSPVFDSLTGKVLGITSHGHEDYRRDGNSSCKIPLICNPGDKCYLSTASRITNLPEEFKVKAN